MNTFPNPLSEEKEKYYLTILNEAEFSFDEKKNAKQILVERNLRLVAHIAKKYQSADEDMEDLISVGTIGLIKAIDSYDYGKGIKLATYAARCIENELLMLFRSKKKCSKEISLYEPLGTDKEGNEISLFDIYENGQEDVGYRLEKEIAYSRLYEIMNCFLTSREKLILSMRFGFGIWEEMTQKEIGKVLGISRSYVSRIEKRAIEKIRRFYDFS